MESRDLSNFDFQSLIDHLKLNWDGEVVDALNGSIREGVEWFIECWERHNRIVSDENNVENNRCRRLIRENSYMEY